MTTMEGGRVEVRYRRVDKSLSEPCYQTGGACAFDLYARYGVEIPAGALKLVPANIVVEVPSGYVLVVAARSSLPKTTGCIVANGIGLIDQDYNGPEDEVGVMLYNLAARYGSEGGVIIHRGDRIAQALLVPTPVVHLVEVDDLSENNRGGFGSSGGYLPRQVDYAWDGKVKRQVPPEVYDD